MPEYIGHKETILDKVLFGFMVAAILLLLAALSQPAWRGDEMEAELIVNCNKRGGVVITNKSLFGGESISCEERLD